MKISRIDATPLAIPLRQGFHWASGAQHGANLVLFSVHTEDGVAGYGETVCEAPGAVAEIGLLMARQLIGRSVGDVEAILRSIWTEGRWKTTPQFTGFVLAGIEAACWDALGRTLGVPTRQFFGGLVQAELDYFAFLQGDDVETLAGHARQLAGHEVFYLKVGRPRDDDAIVAAVRDAIGPTALLRIDPNEAWDAATAVDRIRRLADYDLDWVEQPVSHWDVAGLAHVRRKVEVKIAADQAVYTTRQLREVLEAEAADVVVQGPHDAGGLLPFRRQASLCEAWGLNVNLHAFMQSEISFLAHAQVASTVPNLTHGNQAMHQLLAERLTTGVDVETRNGKYVLNDAPGHG
ncbi:MAG: mandelate racemase/muconate lactonizing enzyme family protein, partial [Actinomycetota bacterium]